MVEFVYSYKIETGEIQAGVQVVGQGVSMWNLCGPLVNLLPSTGGRCSVGLLSLQLERNPCGLGGAQLAERSYRKGGYWSSFSPGSSSQHLSTRPLQG
jgi:hypothetical protein